VTAALDPFVGARRRELSRLLVLSCMAHAGLFALLSASWLPRHSALPAVISVDLVSAPRAAPAPAPAKATPAAPPEPAPVAQPKPPPPPKPAKVVLPKEPLKKPAKQEKAPEKAKPEQKPEPKPKSEPPPTEDYDDVLANLREQAGEKRPEAAPDPEAPAESSAPAGASAGALVSPELAAWVRLAKIHVRRAWIVPPGFKTQTLVATFEIELDAGGRLVGEPDVLQPSGNPWYDEGVVRALQKASPLPAPPEAGRWKFAFDSSEAL
jgi:outer membrane biosynthesis protein TonB